MATCNICDTRKSKRFCPSLNSGICPQCCGQEREETIPCPFECEFLLQGRAHEKLRELKPEDIPFPEIVVKESFLRDHDPLIVCVSTAMAEGIVRIEGLIDADVKAALSSLIKTYHTLGSGIIYESKPQNPIAAALHELIQLRVGEFRDAVHQQTGFAGILDSHILGVLIFFQRMELQLDNGRRRGRSFLDAVRRFIPTTNPETQSPSLLI